MAGAVASAWVGARAVRAGDVATHRRWMNRAGLWVIAFLASYLLKLALLGREPLADWSPDRLAVLSVHRAVVESMLVLGVAARILGPRGFVRGGRTRAVHRLLGRVVLGAATVGIASAAVVLVQMILAAAP